MPFDFRRSFLSGLCSGPTGALSRSQIGWSRCPGQGAVAMDPMVGASGYRPGDEGGGARCVVAPTLCSNQAPVWFELLANQPTNQPTGRVREATLARSLLVGPACPLVLAQPYRWVRPLHRGTQRRALRCCQPTPLPQCRGVDPGTGIQSPNPPNPPSPEVM